MRSITRVVPVALALLLVGSGAATATTMLDLSVSELSERSDLVFIGTVTHVKMVQVNEAPTLAQQPVLKVRTDVTFEVERVLKGKVQRATFELSQWGGTAGEGRARITQVVHGYPSFEAGERVVLFVETADTGVRVVTGLSQGKYRISKAADGSEWAERGGDDHGHTVQHRLKPDAVLLGAPESATRMQLGQLEALVRGDRPARLPVKLIRPTARIVTPVEGAR